MNYDDVQLTAASPSRTGESLEEMETQLEILRIQRQEKELKLKIQKAKSLLLKSSSAVPASQHLSNDVQPFWGHIDQHVLAGRHGNSPSQSLEQASDSSDIAMDYAPALGATISTDLEAHLDSLRDINYLANDSHPVSGAIMLQRGPNTDALTMESYEWFPPKDVLQHAPIMVDPPQPDVDWHYFTSMTPTADIFAENDTPNQSMVMSSTYPERQPALPVTSLMEDFTSPPMYMCAEGGFEHSRMAADLSLAHVQTQLHRRTLVGSAPRVYTPPSGGLVVQDRANMSSIVPEEQGSFQYSLSSLHSQQTNNTNRNINPSGTRKRKQMASIPESQLGVWCVGAPTKRARTVPPLKGETACFRCYILQLRCSGGQPCSTCEKALAKGPCMLKQLEISRCHNKFSDVDIFRSPSMVELRLHQSRDGRDNAYAFPLIIDGYTLRSYAIPSLLRCGFARNAWMTSQEMHNRGGEEHQLHYGTVMLQELDRHLVASRFKSTTNTALVAPLILALDFLISFAYCAVSHLRAFGSSFQGVNEALFLAEMALHWRRAIGERILPKQRAAASKGLSVSILEEVYVQSGPREKAARQECGLYSVIESLLEAVKKIPASHNARRGQLWKLAIANRSTPLLEWAVHNSPDTVSEDFDIVHALSMALKPTPDQKLCFPSPNTPQEARLDEGDAAYCVFSKYKPDLAIDHSILENAADACDGDKIMQVLFKYKPGLIIRDSVVAIGVRNQFSGSEILNVLFDHNPDLAISEAVLVAAIGNEFQGPQIVVILLEHQPALPLSETVLIAAARNEKNGAKILDILLKSKPGLAISERVLVAAARKKCSKARTLKVLLKHTPRSAISEKVLLAAASNQWNGAEALHALLKRTRGLKISEPVLVAAARNRKNGTRVLNVLLRRTPGLTLSDALLVAKSQNGITDAEVSDIFKKHKVGLTTSDAVLDAAASKETKRALVEDIVLYHKPGPATGGPRRATLPSSPLRPMQPAEPIPEISLDTPKAPAIQGEMFSWFAANSDEANFDLLETRSDPGTARADFYAGV